MQLRSRCFLVRMHDAEYRDMAGQTSSRHRQIGLFDVTACQLSVKKDSWFNSTSHARHQLRLVMG